MRQNKILDTGEETLLIFYIWKSGFSYIRFFRDRISNIFLSLPVTPGDLFFLSMLKSCSCPLFSAERWHLHWITRKTRWAMNPCPLFLATKMPPTIPVSSLCHVTDPHLEQTLTSVMKQQSQSCQDFHIVPSRLKIKHAWQILTKFSRRKRMKRAN